MKNTTLALAFVATLSISSIAAALVVINPQAPRPAKRKGETDVSTRVFKPEVKVGARVTDAPVKVAVSASEAQVPAEVSAKPAAPDPSPRTPVEAARGEPELITEYYPSGAVRAIYRGYKQPGVTAKAVNFNEALGVREQLADCASVARTRVGSIERNQTEMIRKPAKLEASVIQNLGQIEADNDVVICLGTLCLEPAVQYHGHYESFYENGQVQSRGEFVRGVAVGYWSYYHDNGQLRETGELNNGARQGIWTSYYPDGLRECESHWAGGVEHGMHTRWYANGMMAAQGNMKEGRPDGWWVYYGEDGAKLREGAYENGGEAGEWQNYQPVVRKQQVQQEIEDNCQELIDEDPPANPQTRTVVLR